MTITKIQGSARHILFALQQSHQLDPNELDQIWGPIVAYQRDASGNPIQKYMTMLLRNATGKWLMVRQVNNIDNGHEWTSRPTLTEISASSSQHWLLENKFVCLAFIMLWRQFVGLPCDFM